MSIIINANVDSFSTSVASSSSISSRNGMAVSIRAGFSISKNLVISHSIISVSWNSSGFESGNSGSVSSSGFGVAG